MAVISGGNVIGGGGTMYSQGAPGNGTSQVWTVTVTGGPAGGTFKLAKDGMRSGAIAYNSSAAAMQTILEAMPSFGTGNVTVTGSDGGPFTVTAAGELAGKVQGPLTLAVNSLTGGTLPSVTSVIATPGVDAFGKGAAKGATTVDTTNGVRYLNTGTGAAPVWSAESSSEQTALLAAIPVAALADLAATPASFADLAAVRTWADTVTVKVNLILARLRTANILAP